LRNYFRPGEEDGKAYHFVTKESMQAAIGKQSREKERGVINPETKVQAVKAYPGRKLWL
jgi:hypothetical protein